MLVLSRKLNEGVRIDREIEIKVLSIHGNRVKLGFCCPDEVAIHRSELVAARDGADNRAERELPCL